MAELQIKEARGVTSLTALSGAVIKRGDLIGYNSGWTQADASVGTIYYAEYVALEDVVGDGTKVFKAAKDVVMVDVDAPYTARVPQYLSATAGAIAETRPARGVGNLIQQVGFTTSTTEIQVQLTYPKEFEIFLSPDVLDTTSEPGIGGADTGWPGPVMTGTETAYFKGRLPESLVGSVVIARAIFNSINASAGDLDWSIVGAYDGSAAAAITNNQDTGTAITTGDWEQTDADNKILTADVSALFDAGFWLPGRSFAVYLDPDGITAEAQLIGLQIVGLKV